MTPKEIAKRLGEEPSHAETIKAIIKATKLKTVLAVVEEAETADLLVPDGSRQRTLGGSFIFSLGSI